MSVEDLKVVLHGLKVTCLRQFRTSRELNGTATIKIINASVAAYVFKVISRYGLSLIGLTNLSFQTGAQPCAPGMK